MIQLRRAEPEDYAEVGELTAGAYLADGALPAEDPYYDVLRNATARAEHADLWVATDETGVLVGTVTWCPQGSPYHEIGEPGEGEFRALAVAPAGRGRGVGEALVRLCIELATAEGCDSIVISSAEWMASAHRLYQRLGFIRAPERDWSPRPGIRLLVMVRPLP